MTAPTGPNRPAVAAPAERPARVLLVDDRRDNLLALEAILQGLPVQPVGAESGEEALKHLLVDDFALILLDAQMPSMDGFETARHIKRRERTRHVPIIFLTAADRDAHLALRGYAAGAVDYLTKPFDPWVLRAKVSVFVELWAKTQQLAAHAEAARAKESELRTVILAVEEASALIRTSMETDAELSRAHVEKALAVLNRIKGRQS
jgi:CheY-like chemotaxis protein